MRTAVLRVVIDVAGEVSAERYERGLAHLRGLGIDVIAPPAEHLSDADRGIELIIPEFVPSETPKYLSLCSAAFELPVAGGVLTYISRGTDEDALGVLAAFGVRGEVARDTSPEEEVVIVRLDPRDAGRVFEGRLHTALEAALNCEVRVVTGT